MFILKENNQLQKYQLFEAQYIKDNFDEILKESDLIQKRFKYKFSNHSSTTWAYKWYNIQYFTVGLIHYYNIIKSLEKNIRSFVGHNNPLWYQCWINFHEQHELLDWHEHQNILCHGYISIDPKISFTMFEDYTITNTIGQLYLGSINKKHKVEASPFLGQRITLAFDVVDMNAVQSIYETYGETDTNLGYVKID
jgi:hypothetical protein